MLVLDLAVCSHCPQLQWHNHPFTGAGYLTPQRRLLSSSSSGGPRTQRKAAAAYDQVVNTRGQSPTTLSTWTTFLKVKALGRCRQERGTPRQHTCGPDTGSPPRARPTVKLGTRAHESSHRAEPTEYQQSSLTRASAHLQFDRETRSREPPKK